MNTKEYILVIDQGTTSSRVVLIDKAGDVKYKEQMQISLYSDVSGSVRQNANEILESVEILIYKIIKTNNIKATQIKAIGITNQRETTVIFDKTTGKPLKEAISWQSKETKDITDKWIELGYSDIVKNKTGLPINPYFSASKIVKLTKGVKEKDYFVGTIDTFLLYNLSVEKAFKTDITNASRTMIYNINEQRWDDELLKLFKINPKILPEVLPNDSVFGHYKYQDTLIPICSIIGDQQAALFGQQCFEKGDLKATYGTGAFLLVNIGNTPILSKRGLITTIAYKINNKITYALEGSIFIAGAALEWLKNNLEVFDSFDKLDKMANRSTDDTLIFVPSFVGLGTPYWNENVRGAFLGIKRGTSKDDFVKSALDGIAFEIDDVINVLEQETNIKITKLNADGGVSNSNYLLQRQANISNLIVYQSSEHETTSLGAGYLAGLKVDFWKSLEELQKIKKIKGMFYPRFSKDKQSKLKLLWQKAIRAIINFAE